MNMEALPPNLRDLSLCARDCWNGSKSLFPLAPAIPGPESALELLPSSALPSAQVVKAYPKIAALEKPDISFAI